jgi:flagellar biosynthetic protein FliR
MPDQLTGYAVAYAFVLIRIAAILFVFPFWSGRVPMVWKMTGAVWMSVLFSHVVPFEALPETLGLRVLVIGGIQEFLTGALLGFLVRLVLAAITLAGQLAGFQMGLAIANVIDPATSDRYSIVAQLLNLLAMFVFLEMDGHLMAVRVVARSFEWIPPFSAALGGEIFYDLVYSGGNEMFRLALKIGWPISLALLMVYLSMALLVRVAPQINMLMVGFPITISVGLIVIMMGVPTFTMAIERMFQDAFFHVERLLAALRA